MSSSEDSEPPSPESEVEAQLWRDRKGPSAVAARKSLFDIYAPMARQIARRRYFDRKASDIELADLHQLACAGLLEALDRFNPELGVPFGGYARRRITGSVLDGIAKMSEVREQISFRERVRRERTQSIVGHQREGMSADAVLQALAEVAVGLAVGFMLDDTAQYMSEEPSERAVSAYDSLVWKEALERVGAEVARLPDRERLIIRSHYLEGLGFEQVGVLLGVSKGRVSQLHKAAMAMLRNQLSNNSPFDKTG